MLAACVTVDDHELLHAVVRFNSVNDGADYEWKSISEAADGPSSCPNYHFAKSKTMLQFKINYFTPSVLYADAFFLLVSIFYIRPQFRLWLA